ncbi:putative F-box/kelch-repeat protein [Raphanus sativus]|nr:putative F-box/kelch-repeat protein [Raphanus sativus]
MARSVQKNKKMSKPAREWMLLNNEEVYSIAGDLYEIYNNSGVVEPTIEFTGKLTSLKTWEDIYHCDGLMLCQTNYNNPRLVVWNPCTGQTKSIKPRTRYRSYVNYSYALGLGYSTTCSRHSYKIMRSCRVLNDKRVMVVESQIYELSSYSWKEVVVVESFSLQGTSVLSGSVSLKGDCYWVAPNKTTGCFLMKFFFFFLNEC